MSQERLNGLTTHTVECVRAQGLKLKNIIDDFAKWVNEEITATWS